MSVAQRKITAKKQAQLVKLLWDGVYNCRALADMTGLHYATVRNYCKALYDEGAVHIASWEKDRRGADKTKVYKLGPGRDAQRACMTDAQRVQRQRDRKKAMQLNLVMAGRGRLVQAANGLLRFEPTTLTN